jgi:hypothetical protein
MADRRLVRVVLGARKNFVSKSESERVGGRDEVRAFEKVQNAVKRDIAAREHPPAAHYSP